MGLEKAYWNLRYGKPGNQWQVRIANPLYLSSDMRYANISDSGKTSKGLVAKMKNSKILSDIFWVLSNNLDHPPYIVNAFQKSVPYFQLVQNEKI